MRSVVATWLPLVAGHRRWIVDPFAAAAETNVLAASCRRRSTNPVGRRRRRLASVLHRCLSFDQVLAEEARSPVSVARGTDATERVASVLESTSWAKPPPL